MKVITLLGFGPALLSFLLGQETDSVVVKYYSTVLTRTAILKNSVPYKEVAGKPHFRAEYSPAGKLLRVEFIPGDQSLPVEPGNKEPTAETKSEFVPLTPEEQAALNPDNEVIQTALFWARWKGRLFASRTETETERKETPDTEEDRQQDTSKVRDKEKPQKAVIAVFQSQAPEPVKESLVVRGTLKQKIITAEPGGIRFFRKWNIRTGELTAPISKQEARARYYRAYFDERGFLKRVTYYDKQGKRRWSYRLKRDSTGIYRQYAVEFHVRQPLTRLDNYLFAPDLSEMRPGWKARFYLREQSDRPKKVEVYDQNGILYYFYTFDYRPEGDTTSTRSLIISRYYRADSTQVGSHRLFFRAGSELTRIEYLNAQGELKVTKEFGYDRVRKELIVTLRNPQGEIIDRRIIPK